MFWDLLATSMLPKHHPHQLFVLRLCAKAWWSQWGFPPLLVGFGLGSERRKKQIVTSHFDFCQELPCIGKDFPVLGIKPTHKNSPALEIFVVACIGQWLDLVTSRAESIEPVLAAWDSQQPLELELGQISSFCSFWQKIEDRKPFDQCVRAQFLCVQPMSLLGSP